MQKIKIPVNITYWQGYLPTPRHRKLRYREAKTTINVSVAQVSEQEAPVAFRLSDYAHKKDNHTEIRYYKKRLYQKLNSWDVKYSQEHDNDVLVPVGPECLEGQIRQCLYYRKPDEAELPEVTRQLRRKAKEFIVIDGCVWKMTGEPRYVIVTFGLGHNHGGSGLFVENYYNSNISKKRYFSALEGERAVEEFNRVALGRGDTESAGKYGPMIEVLIPEAVKVNPSRQHGNGDAFMNTLEDITQKSDSAMEAGLLAMAAALK